MAGKLDEISRVIGGLESDIRGLVKSVDQDRRLANTRHAENLERLDRIDEQTQTIPPVVADVGRLKTQVGELMEFKAHWSAIIVVAVGIISGALTLIWQGVVHIGEIKGFFSKLLGP